VDHVLHGIGDDLAAGQRVEHARVSHGDAVVHGDGVELLGHAAGGTHRVGDDVTDVLQVHVPGHELGVGVDDRHDRLAELVLLGAGGPPQGAGSGSVAADGGDFGTKGDQGGVLLGNGREEEDRGRPTSGNQDRGSVSGVSAVPVSVCSADSAAA